jgi:hypothetical protein
MSICECARRVRGVCEDLEEGVGNAFAWWNPREASGDVRDWATQQKNASEGGFEVHIGGRELVYPHL